PDYTRQGHEGVALSAEWGTAPGLGLVLDVAKSVDATFFLATDATAIYGFERTMSELDVRYRWPLGPLTIDALLGAGRDKMSIIDLPESTAIPDTSTSYIAAGGLVRLALPNGVSFGLGAKFLDILGLGDIADDDWYGAGYASGALYDADLVIPLLRGLF